MEMQGTAGVGSPARIYKSKTVIIIINTKGVSGRTRS